MAVNPELRLEPDFRLLFEASPHPYLVLRPDPSFTIVAVNESYLKATGTSRHDTLDRGLFEVFPDNPADESASGVSDLRISLDRVLNEGVQDIMGVQKYDIPRRDGGIDFEVKYWSPVNTPVVGKDGSIAFIIHHVEDVTDFILAREKISKESAEQIEKVKEKADRMEAEVRRRATEVKEANRQIKAANEELERRESELALAHEQLKGLDKAKTEFFSNISHEFRTPLTLIIAPLMEVLSTPEGEVSPNTRTAIAAAHRNALRLLKLVNTLLDFSRIEAGRARVNFEPTDLASLTSTLASHFQSVCDSAGLQFVVDCPTLSEPVCVDRQMWEKIVLNLISNAFKFTFDGMIETHLGIENGFAELTVRDTGTGIPKKELPHIFERFHRVEGVRGRSYEGTGIGLSLVSELVRLHAGTIHVESELGRGSNFTVRLPLGSEHLSQQGFSAVSPDHSVESSTVRASSFSEEALLWLPETGEYSVAEPVAGIGATNGRVVVADDNADMRAYISRLLEGAGYAVEASKDGEAALAACRLELPDLILSDVMMPGLDGFTLLQHLRAEEHTAVVPVILLSARAGEEARIEGLAAGADDYLVKPFGARELVARVDGAIRLARVRREAAQREHRVLAEANALLERSNQALRDFASIASHDLQEPLRKVSTFGGMLKQKCGSLLGVQGNGYLERVLDANQRMQSLLTALLEYSRLSTRADPFVEVELKQIIREVLSDLEARIQSSGGEVYVGDLPVIPADPTQMRQLFQNLIGNALKFHKEGEKPSVKVSCIPANNGVAQIIVEDNGIGFEEQYLEKIFAPFQRLHSKSSPYEGTGMGLAICKKIVERHGGSITAQSAPGQGATFIITLSRYKP